MKREHTVSLQNIRQERTKSCCCLHACYPLVRALVRTHQATPLAHTHLPNNEHGNIYSGGTEKQK